MRKIGIFNSSKSSSTDREDLLKYFSDVTPEDIKTLVNLLKNHNGVKEPDDNLDKYLALVQNTFGKTDYLSIGDTVETRQQRYEIYDEMDESTSYISAALDILSDDATQPDENGIIIRVNSESAKVTSIVEELFDKLEVEENLGKWARAIAKYGDFFVKVVHEENKGITNIIDTIYPSTIERKDLNGKLLAFSDVFGTTASDSFYAPWDFVHFRHKGDIYRSQKSRRVAALNKGVDSFDMTSSYGQSILRPAIKVYAQLRFVENIIILSRLTNSIKRNIFLVNTGDVDPKKSYETIRMYADLLKKDISLDIERGVYNSQKHTISYDEDIFIPVSDTKNDLRIEQVGGDVNIEEQYDLEYLLNKLFSALKIPKAYLNYEQDLNARSTLIQLDIRYAKSVSQLQNTLVGGLLRLAKIQLSYLGMDPDSVDLDIQLTNVSSIDKEARLEQKKISVETADSVWSTVVKMNSQIKESEDKASESNADIENTSTSSPMDLTYFAEHVLAKYLELDQEDIDKLFKKEKEMKSENLEVTKLLDRKKYSNSDLHEAYPRERDCKDFEILKEDIISGKQVLKD